MGFFKEEKDSILYGTIAGIIGGMFLGRIDSDLNALISTPPTQKFFILIFVGIILAMVIKRILNGDLLRGSFIRRQFKDNILFIIAVAIAGIVFLGNAGVFLISTGPFAGLSLKAVGLLPLIIIGLFSLATIPTFGPWLFIGALVIGFLIFGIPLIGLTVFILNHGTLIAVISGVIIAAWFIGKRR